MQDGTARALGPIARQTLLWVANQKKPGAELRRLTPDELRRIELCAKVALNVSDFQEVYGAADADLREQRRPAEGVPGAAEEG